jgi:ppGpp synthetase/RelA/SpoT-type nucleotidyltranferase
LEIKLLEHLLEKAKSINLTKSHVRKIGEKLRKGLLEEETIEELEIYRLSYKKPLSVTYKKLDEYCSNYKDSIVTYRIKRFESIIDKLQRFPKMQLERMGDIGGCRCILKNKKEVYSIYNTICSNFEIYKVNDYYEKPQEDGYKSIHVYIKDSKSKKIIEVQLRNSDSHEWATLVEISDILFSESIKTKSPQKKELQEFHKILSRKSLSYKEKEQIINIVQETNYIDKLIYNYKTNYIPTRMQWAKESIDDTKSFILITNDIIENTPPDIKVFKSFEEAETAYFSKYDNFHNSVLTHIQKPTYEKVSKAYSNYILTYHSFISIYFSILESACIQSLNQNKIFKAKKYYILYKKYWSHCITNSLLTWSYLENISELAPKKLEHWKDEINKEMGKIIKLRKIEKKLNNIMKQKPFSGVIIFYFMH